MASRLAAKDSELRSRKKLSCSQWIFVRLPDERRGFGFFGTALGRVGCGCSPCTFRRFGCRAMNQFANRLRHVAMARFAACGRFVDRGLAMRAAKFYARPADSLPEPIDQECRSPGRIVLADLGLGLHDPLPDQFQQPSTPKRSKFFPMRIPIKPFGHRHLPTSSRAAARDGWIPRDEKKEAKTPFLGYNKAVERVQTFGVPIPSGTLLSPPARCKRLRSRRSFERTDRFSWNRHRPPAERMGGHKVPPSGQRLRAWTPPRHCGGVCSFASKCLKCTAET